MARRRHFARDLVRRGLFGIVAAVVPRDGAIEARNYRLDERVAQYLAERLPGVYIGTRQFSLQVYIGRHLVGAPILEQMRRAANREFLRLMQNAGALVLLVVVDLEVREHRLDV